MWPRTGTSPSESHGKVRFKQEKETLFVSAFLRGKWKRTMRTGDVNDLQTSAGQFLEQIDLHHVGQRLQPKLVQLLLKLLVFSVDVLFALEFALASHAAFPALKRRSESRFHSRAPIRAAFPPAATSFCSFDGSNGIALRLVHLLGVDTLSDEGRTRRNRPGKGARWRTIMTSLQTGSKTPAKTI